MQMSNDIKIKDIPGLTIDYDGELSLEIRRLLMRCGARIHPELIPGSSVGTIFEDNSDVAGVKHNPTKANWYIFLKKNGWRDFGENLVLLPNPSWEEAYAMAKTFTGKAVSFDFPVTKDSFCENSFLCFPKAMDNILKAGYLDCLIVWESINHLLFEATLNYPDHYNDCSSELKISYWTGALDRNGQLIGKLQLHKSENETYSS